jgi:hypothetical protein
VKESSTLAKLSSVSTGGYQREHVCFVESDWKHSSHIRHKRDSNETTCVSGNDANQPVPDILIVTIAVFQIWKFEPSVPFLVAMIAAKKHAMRLISKLGTVPPPPPPTLWH